MISIATALLLLYSGLLAAAALQDVRTLTISNLLCLATLVASIALIVLVRHPAAPWEHAASFAIVLGIGFLLFSAGWIGGGDAKLAAATALWLGFDHLMPYLLYASLLGGALTLLLVQFRMVPLPQALARQEWIQRLHRKDGDIPYGIALAAAALIIYPDTRWMTAIGI